MADYQRPQKPTQKDKNLITEQSGLTILMSGFLLALSIGFAIRGFIHPSKVYALVAEAAKQIHKEIDVQFEAAEISFADGAFPRLSVIVKNAQLKSENLCWMRPILDIDEIELPINIFSFFSATAPVTTIKALNVHLRLLGEKSECKKTGAEIPLQNNVTINQSVSLVKKVEQNMSIAPTLDRLMIQKLEIDPIYYPKANLILEDVELFVKSNQPRIISLKAQSHILKDIQWGDYAANAQLMVEYSEFPDRKVDGHVFGNWREGSYSWDSSYRIDEDFFQTEVDLRHIPISKLASLGQRWGLDRFESMKQVWLSMKAKASGSMAELQKTPLNIHDFKVEGDSGEIIIDQLDWNQLADISPQPFLAQMNSLSLQSFFNLSSQIKPSPILGNLGLFTGRAEVVDISNLKIFGDLQGLQFIFSNKGQREFQLIKKMNLDIQRNAGKWMLNISRIEPDQGIFSGELLVNADSGLNDVHAKLTAEELVLSPNVQKLMSGGNGSLGIFQARIDFSFHQGMMQKINGKLIGKDIDIENIKLPKLQMQFQTDADQDFITLFEIPELKLNSELIQKSFLAELKDIFPTQTDDYLLKQVSLHLNLKDFNQLKWKKLNFLFSEGFFESSGGWDGAGILSGYINVNTKKMGAHKYILDGTRDLPSLKKTND